MANFSASAVFGGAFRPISLFVIAGIYNPVKHSVKSEGKSVKHHGLLSTCGKLRKVVWWHWSL